MKTKNKNKGRFFHWIVVCVDYELVIDTHISIT